ncbi:unnamed protein product [Echinostoma caproni]|uniref:Uncharacterized protein n=1 Tax=Echinostoma caproni TaxID=27848 RepID=A0A182ZZR5_9TREM|nr:unnamed protein product [Echinostoma caproni]
MSAFRCLILMGKHFCNEKAVNGASSAEAIREAKGSCLGRVPFTSVIGFVLILVGGGVLCGSLYHGLSRTDTYMRDHFFPIYSLQYLRIAAVVNGSVTIVLAFIIVIFATLVTSATRGRIYRGDRCIMGGRLSAAMGARDVCTYLFVRVFLVNSDLYPYPIMMIWD